MLELIIAVMCGMAIGSVVVGIVLFITKKHKKVIDEDTYGFSEIYVINEDEEDGFLDDYLGDLSDILKAS